MRRLNSASSSTAGSVSDLEDRVVMLCEDIPTESSFDSGRGSYSVGARSSRGSHSEDQEPHGFHQSRDRLSDRLSHRQISSEEREPAQAHREYYTQRVYEFFFKSLRKS